MKWIKILFITLIGLFIISLFVVDKKLDISVTNTTDKDSITVSLNINEKKPIKTKIGYSMFPKNFYNLESNFGFQRIRIDCSDLKISKEIKVFTVYNNHLDFEFTTDLDNNYILIDRKSWFKLTYE